MLMTQTTQLIAARILLLTSTFLLRNICKSQDFTDPQYALKNSSSCFQIKGIPTAQLTCPAAHLIKVQSPFYGIPRLNKNQTCWYEYHNSDYISHCTESAEVSQNCNGEQTCAMPVSNPFLPTCRDYAWYLQVNYTCIPSREVLDICRQRSTTATHGFIGSPNFPKKNYTSDLDCGCQIQASQGRVILKYLFFEIDDDRTGGAKCQSDMMDAGGLRYCGYFKPKYLPFLIEVDGNHDNVRFRTNNKRHARGFWIEVLSSSPGSMVTITCQSYTQSDILQELPTDEDFNDLIKSEDKHPYFNGSKASEQPSGTVSSDDNKLDTNDEVDSKEDSSTAEEEEDNANFVESLDKMQIITGVVVGCLILIAVVIVIVLVFRR